MVFQIVVNYTIEIIQIILISECNSINTEKTRGLQLCNKSITYLSYDISYFEVKSCRQDPDITQKNYQLKGRNNFLAFATFFIYNVLFCGKNSLEKCSA